MLQQAWRLVTDKGARSRVGALVRRRIQRYEARAKILVLRQWQQWLEGIEILQFKFRLIAGALMQLDLQRTSVRARLQSGRICLIRDRVLAQSSMRWNFALRSRAFVKWKTQQSLVKQKVRAVLKLWKPSALLQAVVHHWRYEIVQQKKLLRVSQLSHFSGSESSTTKLMESSFYCWRSEAKKWIFFGRSVAQTRALADSKEVAAIFSQWKTLVNSNRLLTLVWSKEGKTLVGQYFRSWKRSVRQITLIRVAVLNKMEASRDSERAFVFGGWKELALDSSTRCSQLEARAVCALKRNTFSWWCSYCSSQVTQVPRMVRIFQHRSLSRCWQSWKRNQAMQKELEHRLGPYTLNPKP